VIYTDLTKKAMQLCFDAHQGQTDKSGLPYVFHPMHVAEQMQDEITTIVALLHDVVEDTKYTLEDLREMGFPEEVVEAVSLLTKHKGLPEQEYYDRIKKNQIAKTVKLADLRHNSDLTRLNIIADETLAKCEKYKGRILFLEEE